MLRSFYAYVFRHHVALVALFVAMGGVSYAAVNLPRNSVGPQQIKRNAVKAPEIAKDAVRSSEIRASAVGSSEVADGSLLGKDFAPGQLPGGATGAPGATGPPGSPGASALTGRATNNVGPDTVSFLEPNGSSAYSAEDTVTHLSPNATIVARDLSVKATFDSSGATSAVFTLIDDGTATGLTCTMTAPGGALPGEHACDSGIATAVIAPGSELSLRVATVQTSVLKAQFGWRATTP